MTKVFCVVNCERDQDHQDVTPQERGKMIGKILSDRRNVFSVEALAGKSVEELANLCDLIDGRREAGHSQATLNAVPVLNGSPARGLPPPGCGTPSMDLGDHRDRAPGIGATQANLPELNHGPARGLPSPRLGGQ
jgi:hypothetical protein